MPATYHLSHLRTLEAEAVHVMREVAAEFERLVLLFSGGKDSIVLLRLAEKCVSGLLRHLLCVGSKKRLHVR